MIPRLILCLRLLGIIGMASCAPAEWARNDGVLGDWVFHLSDSTRSHTATVQARLNRPVGPQGDDARSIVGVFSNPPAALLKSLPRGDSLDGYAVRPDSFWVRLGRGGDAGEIEIYLRRTADGWRGRWCQIFFGGGPCGDASGFRPRK